MIVRGGVTISKWDASYFQNKKAYNKETNASKSVRPKSKQKSDFSENTQFKNANSGNKGQNQNSKQNFEQKSKQNSSQDDNQKSNKNKSRFCDHRKVKSHNTVMTISKGSVKISVMILGHLMLYVLLIINCL